MSEVRNSIYERPAVLRGERITREFGGGKKLVKAVSEVSFCFHQGEIASIVGESGSGKTTLMMLLMGLLSPTRGDILFQGKRVEHRSKRAMRLYWQDVQAIFQDPFSSFNQFFRVSKNFEDCLRFKGKKLTRAEKRAEFERACSFVNLEYSEIENKYSFELSGGQMQRLMIARIFLIEPSVLIADEPTSMIDACSRSTILEMLMQLRKKNGMTIIFITHDLGLAYYISDTLYIMQKGKFVEVGPAVEIIRHPQNEYTRHLLSDVPKMHEEWILEDEA